MLCGKAFAFFKSRRDATVDTLGTFAWRYSRITGCDGGIDTSGSEGYTEGSKA